MMNTEKQKWFCILSADIKQYSSRKSDVQITLAESLKKFSEAAFELNPPITRKYIGDALLATFDSVAKAIQVSGKLISQQDAWNMKKSNRDLHIKLRIGIDSGDSFPEMDENSVVDVYGEFVNAAARIQSVAKGVWISENAYSQLDTTSKIDVKFTRVGKVDLPKSFGQRIVYAVLDKDDETSEIQDWLHPYTDVTETLNNMGTYLFAVDGFIEISKSQEYIGWSKEDMDEPKIKKDQHTLPKELEELKKKHPKGTGGSQSRYSLKSISLPLSDAETFIKTVLQPITYLDLYTQSKCLDDPCIRQEGRSLTPRMVWGYSWFPLNQSKLVHNINSQPIIITSDNKLIFAKRSEEVHFYPKTWSCSIEEQMVGPKDNRPGDSDFFDCAERGVREELGCTPISGETKVLSVGIEYENLSASFICVVHIEESYEQACGKWITRAIDFSEAVAIDGLELTMDKIVPNLLNEKYCPTKNIKSRIRQKNFEGFWHPTTRMRLYALSCHLFGQDKVEKQVKELGDKLRN